MHGTVVASTRCLCDPVREDLGMQGVVYGDHNERRNHTTPHGSERTILDTLLHTPSDDNGKSRSVAHCTDGPDEAGVGRPGEGYHQVP